jgi:hypothetical protein
VRHSAEVMELVPKLKSSSQLMFFDGERNSVLVAVCGTSVPDVWDEVDVEVDVDDVDVDVVERALVDVDVVDDELEDGLLEHAANPTTHAGRTNRGTDHLRSTRGIGRVYEGAHVTWRFSGPS